MPLFFSLYGTPPACCGVCWLIEKSGKQPHIHIGDRTWVVEIAVSLPGVTAITIITATNKQPLRHTTHS